MIMKLIEYNVVNRTVVTVAMMATAFTVVAQTGMERVLGEIESNNTTLKALKYSAEAEKIGNRTDIFLDDPNVGFNYLWGNPSSIGNRYDISVSQSFDFATLSGKKSKTAQHKNELVDWQYRAERMNILLEAKTYYIDVVYYNALINEMRRRQTLTASIAAAEKVRLDKGDANIIDYNKVVFEQKTTEARLQGIVIERDGVLAQLVRLNGGKDITVTDTTFDIAELPSDFSEWYTAAAGKSPIISFVKKNIELRRSEVALAKSMNLPTITAGYMSENVVGERFQGISLGVTVPLWSGKNKVRQANSELQAAESRAADVQIQFQSKLEILYSRARGLRKTAELYRSSLALTNNDKLLKKALEAGEISIIDYITEMEFYYDSLNKTLEAERDYHKAFAELCAMELAE